MKHGTRVKYIRNNNEIDFACGHYPPTGTFGTVIEIDTDDSIVCVKWDTGTMCDGVWWVNYNDLEEVRNIYSELVDKIASFFEDEENWRALKSCWLEDGRSEGLRKLLKKALKM